MLTILVVDDDPGICETIRECLEGGLPGVRVETESEFTGAVARIHEVRPDALVLDWYRGDPATGVDAGKEAWGEVWTKTSWFCPIVLYSAGNVDIEADLGSGHPFVRVVQKGAGSDKQVLEHLRAFEPHIAAIHEVAEDLVRAGRAVMRSLAPMVFDAESEDSARRSTLTRATRRRLAAMIDDAAVFGDPPAHAWEQYVFPVLTDHLITGDVLRAQAIPGTQPGAYRVVLTPTCDLVPHGGSTKVNEVLCARCCGISEFIEKGLGLQAATNEATVEKRLRSALSEPHLGGYVLLPACAAAGIPMMAVNLRDLELLAIGQIGPNNAATGFERVASVDSPYRERFTWAYLEIGCRPGVPARDLDALVREIMNDRRSAAPRVQGP